MTLLAQISFLAISIIYAKPFKNSLAKKESYDVITITTKVIHALYCTCDRTKTPKESCNCVFILLPIK